MRTLLISMVLVTACGGGAGDGWKPASGTPDLMSVIDVWAFSRTDVWFIDGSATVQRYDGDSWSTLPSPPMRVDASDAQPAFEVG